MHPKAPPRAPKGLQTAGKAAWRAVWLAAPQLDPQKDSLAIAEVARTVDDLALARAELERDGLTLRQPIVSPRGELLGEQVVIHPADAALRRAQRRLEALLAQLAVTPAARRRYGL